MRTTTRLFFAATVISGLWVQTLVAQAPRIAPISDRMRAFVDEGELAGAVTVVARDGKIVHLDAVGLADIAENRSMTTDALFSIASMTKPVAAVAALIMCEEGKLALDEPIASKLPEFSGGRKASITLRQLLSHTAGLTGNQQNVGTLAETATAVAKRPLIFDPGTQWAYSPGLTIAGRLVEVASGQPFEEFLAQRIFQPLKMTDTTFHLAPEQAGRLAELHRKAPGNKLEVTDNWFLGPPEKRTPNPSGGLFSTAADLVRFWQMLLNGGELDGARILSEASVREMTRSQTGDKKAGFVPGSAWGLGVGIVETPQGVTAPLSPGSFGHGGVYGTQVWVDPAKRAIYLLLIQRVGIVNSDASEFRKAFQEVAATAVSIE